MSQERTDNRSRVIAVAGAKGGVGKTTTAINLAAQLADAGYRTVVLDLDLVMANVLDFLDLELEESTDPTAHEVLAEEATVAEATYEAPGGMDVVPSGPSLESYVKTDLGNMALTIQRLKLKYDYVILDTGAGVSRQTIEPLGGADEVLLVSTPRISAIRDTEKTSKLVERSGGSVRGLVLTKSGTGRSPGPERISKFLGVPLLAHVEEDDAIPDSQLRGVPVMISAPESPAAQAYEDLADALISAHEDGSSPTAKSVESNSDIEGTTGAPPANRDGGDTRQTASESDFEFLDPGDADRDRDTEDHESSDEGDGESTDETGGESTDDTGGESTDDNGGERTDETGGE
ncbi:MAG: AAA family ATPase, partial [Haloarculaceae archaeon]